MAEKPFMISDLTDEELKQEWEKAVTEEKPESGTSKGEFRDAALVKAKRWFLNKICVHNVTGVTVVVSVVPRDYLTWAMKKSGEVEASATKAKLAAAVEKAAEDEKTGTRRALYDGGSHDFSLAVGKIAYVTVASDADRNRLFCEAEVVSCGQKLKATGPAFLRS